jgi:hypothetical protein
MCKSYFYGIYGIEFIYHGQWSDPELIWLGKSFNYYDLENALYADYQEDAHNGENAPDFEIWVKNNAYLARYYLQSLLENKCFYGG